MARENHVLLNGEICGMKKVKKDNEVLQIIFELAVIRRLQKKFGNRSTIDWKYDEPILVVVREKEWIKYMEEKMAADGDMLEVFGTLNTLQGRKVFHCWKCNHENSFQGTMTFVRPLCMHLEELHPKHTEIVVLTEAERWIGDSSEISRILNKKKSFPGKIIGIKELKSEMEGFYPIMLTVQEESSKESMRDWLLRINEISNRIFAVGNLCDDPVYFENDTGAKVSTYQLGISRKVYVEEDSPDERADYPWVRSMGDQAEMDHA